MPSIQRFMESAERSAKTLRDLAALPEDEFRAAFHFARSNLSWMDGVSLPEGLDEAPLPGTDDYETKAGIMRYTILAAFGRWYQSGLQRIVVERPQHAAELAATNVPPDLLEDLRLPWDAFVVDIPPRMVPIPGDGHLTHILLARLGDAADHPLWFLYTQGTRDNDVECLGGTPSDVLARLHDEAASDGDRGLFGRANLTAFRLLLGVVFSLDTTKLPRGARVKGVDLPPGEVKRGPRGAPESTTFVLRPDVKIDTDLRETVRSYVLEGDRGPLTVRTLVRGHWRWQAHGPRHTQRRRQWIRPFWRGPDGAPMTLRPHVLRGEGTDVER